MHITVIIPVYNGGNMLRRCLTDLSQTHYSQWDCIVVDDGSTDDSIAIAQSFHCTVISNQPSRTGPALARNFGANAATGDLLFFIDADVAVFPETLSLAVATMQGYPEISACFGSYDHAPSEPNFLSQYRNLQHHYVHQQAKPEASTFWSGCGVIRKAIFKEMGGFHTITPGRPSIEDIELGYRLKAAGYQIRLENQLLVKHLKHWTFSKMLLTDIRDRAWPWTRLIIQARDLPNDLNLNVSQRVSTAVSFLGLLSLFLAIFSPLYLVGTAVSYLILLRLNKDFYQFLARTKGWFFAFRATFVHALYFLYSGATFALGLLILSRSRSPKV
jgi:glycosyltransferase involved in cell wall biosynthesis